MNCNLAFTDAQPFSRLVSLCTVCYHSLFKHRFPCFWNEQSFQYVDSYCLYHNHCISESISSVEYPHRDDVQRGKQEYLKKEQ